MGILNGAEEIDGAGGGRGRDADSSRHCEAADFEIAINRNNPSNYIDSLIQARNNLI